MAIGPLRRPSTRASASSAVMGLLAVAAVGGGIYYVTQRPAPPPPRKPDMFTQIQALARAETEADWIRRAIRDGRTILGMTAEEVELAKGPPKLKQRSESLSEAQRTKGGVENWVYDLGGGDLVHVLFGANGLVIDSSEVGDSPLPSQVVRQHQE